VTSEPFETEGPVIRDKRRIDPVTGAVREPRDSAAPDPAPGPADVDPAAGAPAQDDASSRPGSPSAAELALAERTADLQRLQAEYVNYKRRVDRDREVAREVTTAHVLTSLLPVLDDIGRAREHEELSGGFKAVAESLERTVTALGLVTYGEPGDPFDPRVHDALMHAYSDEVDGPVCQAILQVGYRLGERVLRPARVAVAEPPHQSSEAQADTTPEAQPDTDSQAAPDLPDADGDIEQAEFVSGHSDDGERARDF